MSNRVVHFEIPCNNPGKTMDFFKEVFGWRFEQFGKEEYWSVMTGDESSPGIDGGIMKRKNPNQPIANSIQVDNLDETIKHIENSGGKIVVPKMAIPLVGWLAYFKDPDGNIHGLFKDDPEAEFIPIEQVS
jgi:predicted enzyme related to lactoylglutathione lyase